MKGCCILKVYHGSKQLFDQFSYDKIGTNGTSEGQGFYFSDSEKIARGYGENGYLYTVEFSGSKSLSSDSKTITRKQLSIYLTELNKQVDYLSNWGEIELDGFEKVLKEAVEGEYDNTDNDVDMICAIANACDDMASSLTLLHNLFGYDCIICDAEWGKQKLYIALVNDIIKIEKIEEI